MNRYLLLILLTSWSLLVTNSHQCDSGEAKPNSELSVPRSLMANADVAVLKKYEVQSVKKCLEDCCVKKFGNCNVASYRNNATKENCLHFYCLPSSKCEFVSSTSTDSFLFASALLTSHPVPSSHNLTIKSNSTQVPLKPKLVKQPAPVMQQQLFDHELVKEKIATFSGEELTLKNDNTTIKPRKGVEDFMPEDVFENSTATRSSIKPRKGVTMEDVPHQEYLTKNAKSKVKPRKGVEPYDELDSLTSSSVQISPSVSNAGFKFHASSVKFNSKDNVLSNEMFSALEKVFEDDTRISTTSATSKQHMKTVDISPTNARTFTETATSAIFHPSFTTQLTTSFAISSSILHHDFTEQSSKHTPVLHTTSSKMATTKYVDYNLVPTLTPVAANTQPVLLTESFEKMSEDFETLDDVEEAENEKKYKSSMHLVLSLVFGLLVLFAVLGVVAKRIYDGWLRRHYRRMDFLIDGMYNGYG
ncbi:uncharacterized protein LOC129225980 [Uloborus diversus]|uniref:uncharacterized protein LOC129225980 n=1 Tax=Uloborus diversus TaxID=327109 RepID=UPI00240941DA|nr:uncharacterized protein LOC129225980 [Uloborus diversus]